MMIPLSHLLILSGALFSLGLACVIARRNIIMILIGVEIMINAAGLTAVGGSALHRELDGQVFTVFLMTATAAEVAIALAMVVFLRRKKGTIEANSFDGMKG